MKKFRRIILCATAFLLLLAGCGREDEHAAAPAPTPEPSSDPSPSVSIYAATGWDNPDVEKIGYNPKGFRTINGLMVYICSDGESYAGVDVSAHQGEIDWMQVAEAGVDFAMIRVGYRGYETGNLNLDQYFTANIEGALAAGLRVGVYFFSQATDVAEAREEAAQVLEWIAPYEVTYPVAFDWEPVGNDAARTNGVDAETVTECAKAFCAAIKEAGYIPTVYFNKNQAYEVMNLAELSDCDFWLAEYTETPEFRYHFEMWQYSCAGTVPGISTPVDLNICLVAYPVSWADSAAEQ